MSSDPDTQGIALNLARRKYYQWLTRCKLLNYRLHMWNPTARNYPKQYEVGFAYRLMYGYHTAMKRLERTGENTSTCGMLGVKGALYERARKIAILAL